MEVCFKMVATAAIFCNVTLTQVKPICTWENPRGKATFVESRWKCDYYNGLNGTDVDPCFLEHST